MEANDYLADFGNDQGPPKRKSTMASAFACGLANYRGFLWIGCILLLAACAGYWHVEDNLPNYLEKSAQTFIDEALEDPDLSVSFGSATVEDGTGLVIESVKVVHKTDHRTVATIERLIVGCPYSKFELLEKFTEGTLPPPKELILEGVHVNARQSESGNWDLANLFKIKKKDEEKPVLIPIRISNASASIYASSSQSRPITTFHDIDLQLKPEWIEISKQNQIETTVRWNFAGTIAGQHLDGGKFYGDVIPQGMYWRVAGNVKQAAFNERLQKILPPKVAEKLQPVSALSGEIGGQFSLAGKGFETAPRFSFSGKLQNGVVNHERLPSQLSNLKADIVANSKSLSVTNLSAQSSFGLIKLKLNKKGLNEKSPLTLSASMHNLHLDNRLLRSLPPEAQTMWQKFSPAGVINAKVNLQWKDGQWIQNTDIELVDVSLSHFRFPYRLSGCTGSLKHNRKECTVSVDATAGGAKVYLRGHYFNPGPKSVGDLNITVDGEIPIDQKLVNALKPNKKVHQVVSGFSPSGSMTFAGKLSNRIGNDGQLKVVHNYTIGVKNGTLTYERFPYRFSAVSGSIVCRDGDLEFKNFRGQNDGGYVTALGKWNKVSGLDLSLTGQSIPIEEELRLALDKPIQEIWTSLRPIGTIDHAQVKVRHPIGAKKSIIRVALSKLRSPKQTEQEKLSIYPTWFPYEIRDVSGTVVIDQGKISIQNLAGFNEKTQLSTIGHGRFDDTGWFVELGKLRFDRLRPDRKFISALPDALGQAIDQLQVKGMLNVAGAFRVSQESKQVEFGSTTPSPPKYQWNMKVNMADGSIMTGLPLTNIYGGVQFAGESQADKFLTRGTLDVDSLLCQGIRVTEISGPVWVDSDRIAMGSWASATPTPSQTPEGALNPQQFLSAKMFDGRVVFDAQVSLGKDNPFQIKASVDRLNLKEAMLDLAPQVRDAEGNGFGKINLYGNSAGTHTFRGNGSYELNDAKIHEVPAVVALLKLLKLKQVDRTAFTKSNGQFTISGEHLYFNRLEFLGDAISLKGNGELNFDHEMNLKFFSDTTPQRIQLPIISPMLEKASQSTLLISVNGTLSNPSVSKKLFPGLDEKLRDMFPDYKDSRQANRQKKQPNPRRLFR